jgi:hypothetical protein
MSPMIRPSTLRGAPGLPLALSLLLPTLAACGAASRDAVLECTLDADCGPAARCVQGACQASTPPLADFTLPPTITTHRMVSVTGAVTDPDAGEGVAAWAWTVTRLTAACDADVDVGDAAALQVAFWCAGTYEVALVVTDAAGATSAPARRTATVTALDGAPSVSAGPPVSVDHQCASAPLRCELSQPVALTADGQAPLGGPLTYQWTAFPPDASRAGATALVTHDPAAGAALLAISTDGGAISGAWRMRVRAEDAHGNLAQAVQVVTVGNRAPVVDASPVSLDHRYDGSYRVDGPLAVLVSDPDGDSVELGLLLQEPAGSGCSARLDGASGAGGTLALSCPTPAGLLAAGRTLATTATDVNGAAVTAAVPVQARNRLPEVRPSAGAGATTLELDHTVGPCPDGSGPCFLVAGENPFTASDPDGDPVTAVTLVPGVEAGRPASFGEALPGVAGGTFRFGTPVGFPTEFRAADGASGFWLTATASDPFGASAPAQPALAVRVLNRAPVATLAPTSVATGHHYDTGITAYVATSVVAGFTDPDGDPLAVAAGGGDATCHDFSLADGQVSVTCYLDFTVAPGTFPSLVALAGSHALAPRVSDGWATTSHSTTLQVQDQPPTVADYDGAIESCTCKCLLWEPEAPGVCADTPIWIADATKATFPGRPADADGDPLNATFKLWPGSPAGQSVGPAATNALPEACGATISATTFPVTVDVTINDGVSSASAIWIARAVTCSKAGHACTLPPTLRR